MKIQRFFDTVGRLFGFKIGVCFEDVICQLSSELVLVLFAEFHFVVDDKFFGI